MSLVGSLAFLMFLSFPLFPLVYLVRLLFRARSRAPVLAIAYHGQAAAFLAVTGWFVWVAKPALAAVRGTAAASSLPTVAMLALSDLMRTPAGALLAIALAVTALRCSGHLFAYGWRRPEMPAWRLDMLGLVLWFELALLLSLQVCSLVLPLVATVD